MRITPKLGVVFSIFNGGKITPEMKDMKRRTLTSLKRTGIEVHDVPKIINNKTSSREAFQFLKAKDIDCLAVVNLVWTEDTLTTDIIFGLRVPVVLWGICRLIPGTYGSVVGAQMVAPLLAEHGIPYTVVIGNEGDSRVIKEVVVYSGAAAIDRSLRRSRIGTIGLRMEGIAIAGFDEVGFKKILGPRIVTFSMGKYKELISGLEESVVQKTWEEKMQHFGKISISDETKKMAIRSYLAIKQLAQEESIDAITYQCYDQYLTDAGEACLALSLLTSEGLMAACESDVHSALGMLVLHRLSGETAVHNTDIVTVIPEKNHIVCSHCGCASLSLAHSRDEILLKPNVMVGNCGSCVLFRCREGEVTLINLVGRENTYRMCVLHGRAVAEHTQFEGNPMTVEFEKDITLLLENIATEGYGHHWMITYGDWRSELFRWAKLINIKCRVE